MPKFHFRSPVQIFRMRSVSEAFRCGQVITKNVSGIDFSWLITNPGDEIQAEQIRQGLYESEWIFKVIEVVKQANCVVDVGANVANHSIAFSKTLRPEKIIMIEPSSTAVSRLLANCSLNPSAAYDFRYMNYGAASKELTVDIVPPSKFNLGMTKLKKSNSGSIKCLPVDSMVGGATVDLVKIDVEGMEHEALIGLSRTVERDHPAIVAEIADSNFQECETFLLGYGYRQVLKDENYHGMANYVFI